MPSRRPSHVPVGRKKRARKKSRISCKGKVRFRDKTEADRALHRIANGDTRQKTPSRSYFCETCKGWHHTSQYSHEKSGIMKVDRFDKHRKNW